MLVGCIPLIFTFFAALITVSQATNWIQIRLGIPADDTNFDTEYRPLSKYDIKIINQNGKSIPNQGTGHFAAISEKSKQPHHNGGTKPDIVENVDLVTEREKEIKGKKGTSSHNSKSGEENAGLDNIHSGGSDTSTNPLSVLKGNTTPSSTQSKLNTTPRSTHPASQINKKPKPSLVTPQPTKETTSSSSESENTELTTDASSDSQEHMRCTTSLPLVTQKYHKPSISRRPHTRPITVSTKTRKPSTISNSRPTRAVVIKPGKDVTSQPGTGNHEKPKLATTTNPTVVNIPPPDSSTIVHKNIMAPDDKPSCIEGDTYPDKINPEYYYKCSKVTNGYREVKLKCTMGTYNIKEGECVWQRPVQKLDRKPEQSYIEPRLDDRFFAKPSKPSKDPGN